MTHVFDEDALRFALRWLEAVEEYPSAPMFNDDADPEGCIQVEEIRFSYEDEDGDEFPCELMIRREGLPGDANRRYRVALVRDKEEKEQA